MFSLISNSNPNSNSSNIKITINLDSTYLLEPQKPIKRTNYICDQRYHLDYFQELSQNHIDYGLILISGKESLFYRVNQVEQRLIERIQTVLPKQHKKGGQSAARIGRLAQNKRARTADHLAQTIYQIYYDSETNSLNVAGLILAGPAELKNKVRQTDIFQKYLEPFLVHQQETPELTQWTANHVWKAAQKELEHQVSKQDQLLLKEFQDLQNQIEQIDRLSFGPKEVIELWLAGMLSRIIYCPQLLKQTSTSSPSQLQNLLSQPNGAQVDCLNSRTGQDQLLRNYGGIVGIRWY